MIKYENLVNKQYKESEVTPTPTMYDEEMEPVADIPTHLVDNFHNF